LDRRSTECGWEETSSQPTHGIWETGNQNYAKHHLAVHHRADKEIAVVLDERMWKVAIQCGSARCDETLRLN
jgi:hypothetical protein